MGNSLTKLTEQSNYTGMEEEDELKADNEVLKLKLELEHGMKTTDTSGLGPALENQWLNHIYEFEKQFKHAKRIKMYDFIGCPTFVKANELKPSEVAEALVTLNKAMKVKGVALDCICEYDPLVIYRFITEELFDHEMEDMAFKDMMHTFIYEEFYPNHDDDIRKMIANLIEHVKERKWHEEFDDLDLAEKMFFSGKEYDREAMSAMIKFFIEEQNSYQYRDFSIEEVKFDLKTDQGEARAMLNYKMNGSNDLLTAICVFDLVNENGYWNFRSIKVPGFGD